MPTTYFGFGIGPSMFPEACDIVRVPRLPEDVRSRIADLVPCLNPSHAATIEAMRSRFKIDLPIPPAAPVVRLLAGDSLIVMGVSGLPRLEGRHEYTPEEVAAATWTFSEFSVTG